MPQTYLADRGVVKVAGEDARHFLHTLVTSDIEDLLPGKARWFGLLTPQGKILFDGLAVSTPNTHGSGYLLDVARDQAEMLAKRLNFYKLRAKVTVEDLSDTFGVGVIWGEAPVPSDFGLTFIDPRLTALGTRIIAERDRVALLGDQATDWHQHRIQLGVPEGGKDFAWGDAFPHEVLMDQLEGVAFNKGCYIGQEVVSRMHHRGTARTRIVPVSFHGTPPISGTEVTAGGKLLGTIDSVGNERALATLRLDRIGDAMTAGLAIMAGEVSLQIEKPSFIRFSFPGEPAQ